MPTPSGVSSVLSVPSSTRDDGVDGEMDVGTDMNTGGGVDSDARVCPPRLTSIVRTVTAGAKSVSISQVQGPASLHTPNRSVRMGLATYTQTTGPRPSVVWQAERYATPAVQIPSFSRIVERASFPKMAQAIAWMEANPWMPTSDDLPGLDLTQRVMQPGRVLWSAQRDAHIDIPLVVFGRIRPDDLLNSQRWATHYPWTRAEAAAYVHAQGHRWVTLDSGPGQPGTPNYFHPVTTIGHIEAANAAESKSGADFVHFWTSPAYGRAPVEPTDLDHSPLEAAIFGLMYKAQSILSLGLSAHAQAQLARSIYTARDRVRRYLDDCPKLFVAACPALFDSSVAATLSECR